MNPTPPAISATGFDPAFQQAIDALAALPVRERNAFIAFIGFWFGLTWPFRAFLVRIVRPELKDDEVALITGVSTRTLLRCNEYKSLRPKLDDFQNTRRRPSKRRASNRGGYWPLEHPDADCHGD